MNEPSQGLNDPPRGPEQPVRGLNEPPKAGGPSPLGLRRPLRGEVAPKPQPGTPAPTATPPPRPPADPDVQRPRSTRDVDNDIDAALDVAMGAAPPPGVQDRSLKQQWDDEMEAELEAALAGFDNDSYEVASNTNRTRAADRAHVPKGAVGQEERSGGPQQGKVIGIKGKVVFLDMGAKSEAVVPVEQFGDALPNKGDLIEVFFDHFDPSEGLLHMSLKGAAVEANWENLRKGLIVEARVTKAVKGGVEVDVDGIRGFMPISQIDINRVEDAATFLNQKLKAIVTEANQRERNLVLSRRDLLEREREAMREETWAALEEGQVREGVVRSVKPFGAFVDLGGIDGLLHVADMSWVRQEDASSLVKVGQKVQVQVLKIDRKTSKINLGLKQLMPSPWDNVEQNYARGQTVTGKVTRLMDFGAFVELEPGVEGLIHISELSPKRVVRVKDIVQPDQQVDVRILKIEPESQRISLSLRPGPAAPVEPEVDEEDDDTPAAPRPERAVPLKGGLGDRDPNPFSRGPKA